MLRRGFLRAAITGAATPLFSRVRLDHKERVDRALAGKDVDRPPFTFWHHLGLKTPEEHARRTLEFHQTYRTDLVKVMSDFPYPRPKSSGKWYDLTVEKNPFPQQIRALELVRDGLADQKYFLETVFNPWHVAETLSSKEEVRRLKEENPQALLNALDVITQSEISHAKFAMKTGAAGILFSVANANSKELSLADYAKFSRPFDKQFLDAISDAKLNFLHLHVDPSYLGQFRDFKAPVINYSLHVSGIPIAGLRKQYEGVIAGGIDEVHYKKLSDDELLAQWQSASKAAGRKLILTPGCSVPDDSTPAELSRLPRLLGA